MPPMLVMRSPPPSIFLIWKDSTTVDSRVLFLDFNFCFLELDSIGRGRQPWSIRPSAVIVLSDGGMLTNKSLTRTDLELPGSSLPGSALITEPFRWDQRVYSLCLRLDGHGSGDQVDRSDEHVVHGSDPLAALCEVTGGKSYQGKFTEPPRRH